jgi:hypothetical protein
MNQPPFFPLPWLPEAVHPGSCFEYVPSSGLLVLLNRKGAHTVDKFTQTP